MDSLVAQISGLVNRYTNAKELFRQFAANDVHFVQIGGDVTIRNSAGESLLLCSSMGYQRGHLPLSTVKQWCKDGLIYEDDSEDDQDEVIFRLTALGYQLGR